MERILSGNRDDCSAELPTGDDEEWNEMGEWQQQQRVYEGHCIVPDYLILLLRLKVKTLVASCWLSHVAWGFRGPM